MAVLTTTDTNALKKELSFVADFLVDAIIDNLILQGHKGSGKLMKSIVYSVQTFLDGLGFDVYMERYGIYLDKGIKPERIPFSIGSGRQSSKYIQGLIRFAKTLPFVSNQRQAQSIAFAIAVVQKREGMSTVASRRFSATGRRQGFFTDAVEDNTAQVQELLEGAMGNTIQVILDGIVDEIQSTVR
jgi:hypothetical protein